MLCLKNLQTDVVQSMFQLSETVSSLEFTDTEVGMFCALLAVNAGLPFVNINYLGFVI